MTLSASFLIIISEYRRTEFLAPNSDIFNMLKNDQSNSRYNMLPNSYLPSVASNHKSSAEIRQNEEGSKIGN